MENSTNWISTICIGLGTVLLIVGIVGLYGIAFSRNIGMGFLSILFPVVLLVLIGDEQGQKAWGSVALGAILGFIGLVNS